MPDGFSLEGDLAIDTETLGLNIPRDKLCVLQLSNGDGRAFLVQFLENNYQAPNLKKILTDSSRCKIFHFARFDLAAIKYYLNIELDNIFCTKIASRLSRTYTDYHGLRELCRELLGIIISKQQQCSYWGGFDLSSEQQEYAAKDVIYLHQLKARLTNMLIAENRLAIAEEIFKFLPVRANLDLLGWSSEDIFSHH